MSRLSSGMCFAFPPREAALYLTGTEDGFIHRCSVSYAETYLESVAAHQGPVHKVKMSPFSPGVAVSASADWTCKLWDFSGQVTGSQSAQTQQLVEGAGTQSAPHSANISTYMVESGCDAVNDVAWSPTNPTRFASVTSDGRL